MRAQQQQPYGYGYRIRWSAEDGEYVASVAEFPALQSAAFPTRHGALTALAEAVENKVNDLDRDGLVHPAALAVS